MICGKFRRTKIHSSLGEGDGVGWKTRGQRYQQNHRILIDLVRLWEMAFERFANASSNVHSSRHLHASGHSKPVVQLIKNYDMPPGASSGVGPLTKSNCVSDSAVGCRSVVHA